MQQEADHAQRLSAVGKKHCHLAVKFKTNTIQLKTKSKTDCDLDWLLMRNVFKGYGDGFDDVIIQGDLDELRFVAFYTR